MAMSVLRKSLDTRSSSNYVSLPRSSDLNRMMRVHASYVTTAANHSSKNATAKLSSLLVKLNLSSSLHAKLHSKQSTSRVRYEPARLAKISLHSLIHVDPYFYLRALILRATKRVSSGNPESLSYSSLRACAYCIGCACNHFLYLYSSSPTVIRHPILNRLISRFPERHSSLNHPKALRGQQH